MTGDDRSLCDTIDAEDRREFDSSSASVRSSYPEPPAEAAYYGLFGDLVRAIDPHTEADRVALLVQALVVIGSLVGRSAHFVAESTAHYANLFAVLVGVTSKGRKGSAYAHVRSLARALDPTWAEQKGLVSGEGLIWAVRDARFRRTEKSDELDTPICEDRGAEDKRLCVVEPEFASILRSAQREGSSLSSIVRDAWDTECLQTLAKQQGAKATGAHISIIGHITQDEVRRYLTATETANGFANRFLWVSVRRSKRLPDGGRYQLSPRMLDCWRDVLRCARDRGELHRTSAACDLWHAVYDELSEGRPGLLGSVTGRAEAQTMRLALLYALSDCADAIDEAHLEAALALWRYCFNSARHIFGDSLGDRAADDLFLALREAGDVGLTRTEISTQVFSRNKSRAEIVRAIKILLEHGLARREADYSRPVPTERWLVTNYEPTNPTNPASGYEPTQRPSRG